MRHKALAFAGGLIVCGSLVVAPIVPPADPDGATRVLIAACGLVLLAIYLKMGDSRC